METYLLKFSGCLLVLWLLYVLFLEKQSTHHFKRFYLLGALALALIIPTLTITHYIEPVATNAMPTILLPEVTTLEVPQELPPFLNVENVLWIVYGIGVLLFSIRFMVNLFKMYRRISENDTITEHSFIYVLLKEYHIPHSFFNYIFYNKSKFEAQNIPKEVMLHEETHAKQLHSIDILIIEALQIVFWFHPLIYMVKQHIKLNHEFLADQAVLNQGIDTKNYQKVLLQFSSSTSKYQLASAINYSSFKKRFTVMKTETSKSRIWLSSLILLPLTAILFYSFAEREELVRQTNPSIKQQLKEADKLNIIYVDDNIVEIYLKKYTTYETLRNEQPHFINKTGEKQDEMKTLFSDLGGMYFRMSKENKAKVKRPVSPIKPYAQITLNGKTYYKKYEELTTEERATLPPPPPPASKQKQPTKEQVEAYNSWAKRMNVKFDKMSESEKWLGYPTIVNDKTFRFYNDIYARMTQSQLKNAEHLPQVVLLSESPILNTINTKSEQFNANQQKATKKQLTEYNAWAKKLNEAIKKAQTNRKVTNYPIVKKKEYEKFYKIYTHIMTEEQRKNAEAWPNLPPPPPPAPAPKVLKTKKNSGNVPPPPPPPPTKAKQYKRGKKKTLNDIIKETPKGVESGYELLENGESHYYTVYRGKKTYYNKDGYITDDKGKILPPPPPAPQKANKPLTYELENGEIIEVEEVPSPPPPPKTANEFVKSLRNNEITYYFEGKKVSYDKILKITKDNPNISMHSDIKNKKGYVKFWIED